MNQKPSANWVNLLKKTLNASVSNNPLAGSFQLATVKPDGFPAVRTVVFRGFLGQSSNPTGGNSSNELASDLLTYTTHFKSAKVTEIKNNNKFELNWWFPESNLQYRISGYSHLIVSTEHNKEFPYPSQLEKRYSFIRTQATEEKPSQDIPVDWEALRLSAFEQVSSAIRASFAWPCPGKILSPDASPEEFPYTYSEKYRSVALENFVLVLLEPVKVDLVDLKKNDHTRTLFTKEQNHNESTFESASAGSSNSWHAVYLNP